MRMFFRLGTIGIILLLLWNVSEYFGIPLTAVFTSAGIFGMAVAFAARETLENLFGGASLLLDRPFRTGDYITLDTGERERVINVGLRSTRIMTRDDIQITIPNSLITNSKIVNESAPKSDFRVRLQVGVAYGTDIDHVEAVLLSVANDEKMVKRKPVPTVRLRGFGRSCLKVELLCRVYWARDRGRLLHRLYRSTYTAFQEAGIEIPYPQRDIRIQSGQKSGPGRTTAPARKAGRPVLPTKSHRCKASICRLRHRCNFTMRGDRTGPTRICRWAGPGLSARRFRGPRWWPRTLGVPSRARPSPGPG